MTAASRPVANLPIGAGGWLQREFSAQGRSCRLSAAALGAALRIGCRTQRLASLDRIGRGIGSGRSFGITGKGRGLFRCSCTRWGFVPHAFLPDLISRVFGPGAFPAIPASAVRGLRQGGLEFSLGLAARHTPERS